MNISPLDSLSWRKIPKLNIGSKSNLEDIDINTNAPELLKHQTIHLFYKYKDIFAWINKDLKGIPSAIAKH